MSDASTKIPVWRQPDLRRLTLARLISRTGGEAAFFVGMWGRAAFEFKATASQLAVMMAILGISAMLGSATAGVLVDRFGPRRVMIVGEALFAPAALSLILPSTMPQMNIAVALVGFLTMIVMTTVAAFPPFLARDDEELVRANSLVEASGTVGFIAGPAVGAVLAATVGIDWIFVMDAATSLVAVALAARITLQTKVAEREHTAFGQLVEGIRYSAGTPPLRFLLMIGAISWLSFGAFAALEPLFFRDVLRTGPDAIGWVNTVFGIGLVSGTLLLNRLPKEVVRARNVAILTAAGGAGAFLYTGTSDLRVVVAGALYWGLVLGLLFPVLRSLVQLATPLRLQGRVSGVLEMTHNVGELLPLAFVPALAAAFGVQRVLVSSGVLLIVLAVACLPRARRLEGQLPDAADTAMIPAATYAADAAVDPTAVGAGRESGAGVVQYDS